MNENQVCGIFKKKCYFLISTLIKYLVKSQLLLTIFGKEVDDCVSLTVAVEVSQL